MANAPFWPHPAFWNRDTWTSWWLGPVEFDQKWTDQAFRAVSSQTGTLHRVSSVPEAAQLSEDLKCYTVYLKMIFFLTESWVSHQSLSYSVLVSLYCNLTLNFCLTTYDSFSNIFEMQPLLPHLSSCHPSIPSSSHPPLASTTSFLLHRRTKPGCNYCLQVFTHSHILMESNCWSTHNPKMGLNPQVKKKIFTEPCSLWTCQYHPTPLTLCQKLKNIS